jgi:quinol monooxygenase YgiN
VYWAGGRIGRLNPVVSEVYQTAGFGGGTISDEIELAVVLGTFEPRSGREAEVAAVLAKYVVLTRRRDDCRNVDLVASALQTGRLVVIEKWESPAAARAHLDAGETVEMATALNGLLARAPAIDLLDSISAHDLE